jgi:hypothetical protein
MLSSSSNSENYPKPSALLESRSGVLLEIKSILGVSPAGGPLLRLS